MALKRELPENLLVIRREKKFKPQGHITHMEVLNLHT